MARCRVDDKIERVEVNEFAFPLGVYPVDALEPKPGYTSAFEPADGDSEGDGDWEEWPDRYVYDVLVPATRLEAMCRALFALLPGRVYPILDFLGTDEWREVDPYVSYDLLGTDRFLDTVRRFHGFFYEDGLVGFGAMSEEPFLYVFVDEHKVVTVRAETNLKERVERVLAAFDLEQVEELTSADSVTHEHRGVLDAPDDRRDLLNADEIIEYVRDEWRLVLNVDPETNVDADGNELGVVGWCCIVRYDPPEDEPLDLEKADDADEAEPTAESTLARAGKAAGPAKDAAPAVPAGAPPASRYARVFLTADCLARAVGLAVEALEQLLEAEGIEQIEDALSPEPAVVQSDRWSKDDFARAVKELSGKKPDMTESQVWHSEWMREE